MSSSGSRQQSSQPSGSSQAVGLDQLEAILADLDQGKTLAPIDDTTAHGLEIWRDNAPAYHDLNMVNYTKYDVQEWTGRVKKYKLEVCSQGTRVRRLENEVRELKQRLADQAAALEETQNETVATFEKVAELETSFTELKEKLESSDNENVILKRHLQDVRKAAERMGRQTNQYHVRMCLLEAEAAMSKERYENCLGEKERLKLERKWFFQERIFLEQTTELEEKDAVWDELKLRLAKLRHSMHRAWTDAKRDDVRGQIRAARWTPVREEWFTSRKKMFHPAVTFEASTGSSQPSNQEQTVTASE